MENKEQLKQAIRSNMSSIKSGKDLSNLFQELFKETVQELLQGVKLKERRKTVTTFV